MTLFRINANKREQQGRISDLESRVSFLEGELKVLQTKDSLFYELFKDFKQEMRSEFKDIKKELKAFKK